MAITQSGSPSACSTLTSPPFEGSQGCCQWDDPIVLFALALDNQWPLVHLLDLHYLLARIWVVGSVLESELDLLLLSEGVQYCRSYVRRVILNAKW